MSTTKLGTCGCARNYDFVWALDSEHPCVYNQVITTVDGLQITYDYYFNSELMFTNVVTYVELTDSIDGKHLVVGSQFIQ